MVVARLREYLGPIPVEDNKEDDKEDDKEEGGKKGKAKKPKKVSHPLARRPITNGVMTGASVLLAMCRRLRSRSRRLLRPRPRRLR